MEYDKDLRSIQEARDLIKNAKIAQKQFATWSQADIDKLTKHICEACVRNAEPLAKMAQQETGFGKWEDKVLKNLLGSKMTYEAMANLKTVGIINENRAGHFFEVAVPVGVVVALIPSTNPTSTVMYKCLISLKAGNAIVISPHPGAQNCILETVKIIQQACKECGAPDNIVQVVKTPTMQATDTLMKHKDTGLILATGGEAMVHAAYSSGNPALGVGPGNGPAFIEKSADIPTAVRRIVESKTFDNGTICASEQSIITQECIKRQVVEEMKRQHCYFMNADETDKVGRFIMRANNTMNPAIVGKTAQTIAKMAGISIPSDTLILVAETTEVGKKNPYSREKLCPILAFFTVKNWEEACDKSIEILENEGTGHTMTIHSNDEEIIKQFGLRKPVSRVLVNVAASLGGVGALTGLTPALTLGCGAVGGSASSDNIGPLNLMNIRRVAYGTMELDDLRREAAAVTSSASVTPTTGNYGNFSESSYKAPKPQSERPEQKLESSGEITQTQIEAITKEVLREILANR